MTLEELKAIVVEIAGKDMVLAGSSIVEQACAVVGNDIAMRTDLPKLQFSFTITGVGGTWEYTIPNYKDFDRIKTAIWDDGDDESELLPMPIEEFEAKVRIDTTQGKPFYYNVWTGKFRLYPIPDASATIYCTGQKRYTRPEDIDDKFTNLLVKGVLAEVYRPMQGTEQGMNAYLSALSEYDRAFAHLRKEVDRTPLQWGMSEYQKKKNRKLSAL